MPNQYTVAKWSVDLSVRISAELDQALQALARRTGSTRSDVVREALEAYVKPEPPRGK